MEFKKEFLETFRSMVFKACNVGIMQKRDPYGLTWIQRSLLVYLEEKSIKIAEIGKMLCVSKPAMTKVVDSLERKGFIKRTVIDGDRRSYYLVLTEKGRNILRKIDTIPLKAIEKTLQPAPAAERELYMKLFKNFLKRLTAAME